MKSGRIITSLVVFTAFFSGSSNVWAGNAPPGTEYFDPQNPQTETIAQPLETLFDIAERTRSPLQAIIDVNGFFPPYNINAGQVIKLPPLKAHVVQKGETFDTIADRYAIDKRSLANYNKISKPYEVSIGQRIILPPMIVDTLTGLEPLDLVELLTGEIAAGRNVSGSKAGTIHKDDTPEIAAPVFNTAYNNAVNNNQIYNNQANNNLDNNKWDNEIPILPTLPELPEYKEEIPKAQVKSPPPVSTPKLPVTLPKSPDVKMAVISPKPNIMNPEASGTSTLPNINNANKISIIKPKPDVPATGTGAKPPISIDKPVSKSDLNVPPAKAFGDMNFAWPVKGKIVSTFGTKPGFRTNDGIDIEAKENTPFYAAADGEVAYVGDQLPGYGWLILVKHDTNYITAYAYGSKPKVKEGQKVKKGDVLGLVGQTGRAETPRLHFQIRENTKPTNPLAFLPAVKS